MVRWPCLSDRQFNLTLRSRLMDELQNIVQEENCWTPLGRPGTISPEADGYFIEPHHFMPAAWRHTISVQMCYKVYSEPNTAYCRYISGLRGHDLIRIHPTMTSIVRIKAYSQTNHGTYARWGLVFLLAGPWLEQRSSNYPSCCILNVTTLAVMLLHWRDILPIKACMYISHDQYSRFHINRSTSVCHSRMSLQIRFVALTFIANFVYSLHRV